MILAFDTHYINNKANTACVFFENWNEEIPLNVICEIFTDVSEYESGSFYKRELPCILSLLKQIDLSKINFIVIDGFVTLDDNGKFGLGGYLYQSLDSKIPIIGVAKTGFHGNTNLVKNLFRGESKKPLYITSIGIDLDVATENIAKMHGIYRIPTLLKLVDQKCREFEDL